MVRVVFELSERERTHDGAEKIQNKAMWDTILLSGNPITTTPARNALGALSELFPMDVDGRSFQYKLPGARHATKNARVINLTAQSFYDANVARLHISARGAGNMYHSDFCMSSSTLYRVLPTTNDFHIKERMSLTAVKDFYTKYYVAHPEFKEKVKEAYGSKKVRYFCEEVYAAIHGKCRIQDNFIPWSWVADVVVHEADLQSSIMVDETASGTGTSLLLL